MTIHQPRNNLLKLFDKILLLSEGKTVFFGSVPAALLHFSKLGYVCPESENPTDFFLDILSGATIDGDVYKNSEEKQSAKRKLLEPLYTSWKSEENRFHYSENMIDEETHKTTLTAFSQGVYSASHHRHQSNVLYRYFGAWLIQFWLLLKRSLKLIVRDRISILFSLIQTLIVVFLYGIIFYKMPLSIHTGIQNRVGLLFTVVVDILFCNLMPVLAIFPLEKEIMLRERSAGTFRVSATYLSKFISVFPVRLINLIIYSFVLYFLVIIIF